MNGIKEEIVSQGANVEYTSELKIVICHKCSGVYAMSREFLDRRLEDGESWTCPYCRQNTVYGTSKNQELKKQLEAKDRNLRWQNDARVRAEQRASALKRSNSSLRGVVTRKKNELNRVKNGVCPCCNRYFKNLHRHMKNQHPGTVL